MDGKKLFWSDEFNGSAGSKPSSDWVVEKGNKEKDAWGNNELQYYTGNSENLSLDGSGNLQISARKATSDNLPCLTVTTCPYTSARIKTEGTVALKYGRAEIRAKMPTGKGLVPAIWMMGNNGKVWPGKGELDIAEVVGHEPKTVYGTAHMPNKTTATKDQPNGGTTTLDADASEGYHVFAVDKQPNKISWSVDGKVYRTITPSDTPDADWVFEQDMHMLLNVAVGGNWAGDPASTTKFPSTMSVDYVRLYGEGTVKK